MEENKIKDDMPDDGIRILSGSATASPVSRDELLFESEERISRSPRPRKSWQMWHVAALVVLAVAAAWWLFAGNDTGHVDEQTDQAVVEVTQNKASEPSSVVTSLPSSPKQEATVDVTEVEFHKVPLKVFTINGGKAELVMGRMSDLGDDVLLAAHAADVRADKDEPVGVFVVNGEVKSRGQNKNGFCAIINGQITIGQQVETSLFERVINERGSFFRQFSIVSAGQPVELAPRGKAQRRALCITNGQVQVVESLCAVTYGDFSKALCDMGVSDALVLVGGGVYVYCPGKNDVPEQALKCKTHPTANFLVWKK